MEELEGAASRGPLGHWGGGGGASSDTQCAIQDSLEGGNTTRTQVAADIYLTKTIPSPPPSPQGHCILVPTNIQARGSGGKGKEAENGGAGCWRSGKRDMEGPMNLTFESVVDR